MQRRIYLYNLGGVFGQVAFLKSPNSAEFGRTAYSGEFGVRSLFRKKTKQKSDFQKYFLKSYSMYDIIMQRRFHLYNLKKFLLRLR